MTEDLSRKQRLYVLRSYNMTYYLLLREKEALPEHKKLNKIRYVCNTRLRIHIEKFRKRMKAKVLVDYFIVPALNYLAHKDNHAINSLASKQMMLAIAAQESQCGTHFKQLNGCAEGIWQIEPATSQDLEQNFLAYRPELHQLVMGMTNPMYLFNHIQCPMYNCAMARLCLYRYPEPMPEFNDRQGMWKLYKQRYNTMLGKATEDEWNENWERWVSENEAFYR